MRQPNRLHTKPPHRLFYEPDGTLSLNEQRGLMRQTLFCHNDYEAKVEEKALAQGVCVHCMKIGDFGHEQE